MEQLIRDEIRSGKSDKEIYKKLEDEFGETVLYAPKFDLQTAALWLSPVSFESHVIHKYILHTINNIRFRNKVLIAGVAAGSWAYRKHRQKTNVHIMALNLVRGVPLTPKEKQTMLELLTPPPSQATSSFWWSRFQRK